MTTNREQPFPSDPAGEDRRAAEPPTPEVRAPEASSHGRSGPDLHLDCFSGLAGDMFLGACLDLGMPLSVVEEAVAALGLEGVTVAAHPATRGGLAGTRFQVLLDGEPVEGPDPAVPDHAHDHGHGHDHDHDHGHGHGHGHDHAHPHDHGHPHDPAPEARPALRSERSERLEGRGPDADPDPDHPHDHHHPHDHDHDHDPPHPPPSAGGVASRHVHHEAHHRHHPGDAHDLRSIRRRIEASSLAPAVKETALQLFARLGEAEAKAHGVAVDEVHFHEVGAVDSIVDLVGAAAAYHHLAPRRLTCGPVNVGGGTVETAHGRLPVPAPATAWLVRGLPVYGGPGGELLTPTGAAVLAELVDEFGDLPPLTVEAVGYGLGRKHLAGQPNAVRLLQGRGADRETAAGGPGAGRVVVLEAQVDDLPGEGFGFLMERLLEAGALDVYFTPVQMKKNRPGTLVTVLGRPADREHLAALLLAESGSLGCRFREVERLEAARETGTVTTPFGEVGVKWARLDDRRLGGTPEYEDCRRLARSAGVPWREVYRAAVAAAAGVAAPDDAGGSGGTGR